MIGQSISKNGGILLAFALVTAGLIAATFQGTEARIAESERRAAQKALFEIFPSSLHDNDLLTDTIALTDNQRSTLGINTDAGIHVAKKNGNIVAFIFPAIAPDGYSGDIKLITGVSVEGKVTGVRVLAHKETPGLGDKVDTNKSDWVLGFNDKSLENPTINRWKVKKDGGDFDQFTGATITPRAVVGKVKTVLEFYQTNKDELLQKARGL